MRPWTDITWADTATGVCCGHRYFEGACGCEEPFDLRGLRADLEVLADALTAPGGDEDDG